MKTASSGFRCQENTGEIERSRQYFLIPSSAFNNKPGQHLYEKLGYKKVFEDFYTYSLQVK